MSIASSQRSFLANALLPLTHKPRKRSVNFVATVRCRYSQDDKELDSSCRKSENKLAKLAIVALTAGVLTLGSVGDASAAKSGGRVGGQAFRSSAPRSSPRINNNSRTNIYVNPPVAPPLIGGYGYGYGVPFFGGWGWSPFSFFAPGPSVAVGIGGGFDTLVLFLFLGAVAAVIRRFGGSRNDEDDY
ncbi:hypothetical protein K2173_015919 [Erythroxylum novogranatense]|uniref:La-related protein 6 n=1 Tax=Erythroxylum novogranatense TaxID=1862640 RepID=A0AAV8SFF8_9ROSI|nr:hypothetical protein K2173_015919 [Erythroxylum novogranatense]